MRFDIGANIIDVDGRTVEIDTAVVKVAYVPYRAIGELLGAEVLRQPRHTIHHHL